MHTTIIIPTYNERGNISKLIPEITALLPEVDILVVDDNSPDKTYEVVREMQKSIPSLSLLLRPKKEGLGKAYIDAFRTVLAAGKSDVVVMMDADFSHDPKYLPLFLQTAREYDVVFGSRYINGGAVQGWDARRRLLSRFANFYARNIVRIPIFDYTAGFILMKTDFLRRLDLDKICANGYAFLIELKSLLWSAGARFKELPIVLGNRTIGQSKMSLRIIWEGVLAPWKIRSSFLKNFSLSKEKYFFDFDFSGVKNKLIFLDIDGTIVHDGGNNPDEKTVDQLKKLSKDNQVFFCSNKKNPIRARSLAALSGIKYLDIPCKKPSKKILDFIQNENSLPMLVIGDKILIDGLFAKNIKAEFIKIRRCRGAGEGVANKFLFLIDDIVYRFLF